MHIFLAKGIDISHDRDLNMLVKINLHRAPRATQGNAKMGSHGSSEASYEASLEPMNMASLADMTRKLAFLLTLASAKRKCGPSALMYASGKIAASEVSAFRAVVHFRQAVVSAKSVWPKTMYPSKPETFMHLSRSITPIYGRGSPCQVFLCPVKRAQRCYLKLSIKGQHPNNKFRHLLCAFIWGTQVIYPSRQCQGGSDIWSHKAYSEGQDEDIPHLTHTNFQARELRAFASSLAFHPTIP